jgi:hypothetical protein
VKASGSSGASPPQSGGLGDAARVRTAGPDFSVSLRALQDAVRRACAAETQWQARIVVGLRAVLEFAAADPAAARALTIQARNSNSDVADNQDGVIAYFVELLGELTPAEKVVAVSTDQGVVDSIATIIRGHLLAGTAPQLPGAVPDLVYLTLLPYTGLTEARRWASSAPGL